MKFFFLILSSLLLISCSSSNEQPSKPNAPLTNTRWILKVLNGNTVTTPQGGKEIFLTLSDTNNRATGSGGCNNFFSQYTVTGRSLKFGPVASTEMYCENKMEIEGSFFKALQQTRSFKIKGENLLLSDSLKVIAKLEAVNTK